MVSLVHRKLNQMLAPFLAELDPEGKEILEDLVRKLYPFERLIIPMHGAQGFWGKKGGVVGMQHSETLAEFLRTEVEEFKKDQFATAAENRRYCEGTTGLLSLLTQYHYQETKKCVVMAYPDARVHRNNKASLTAKDLKEFYDNEREVNIVFVMDKGFLAFEFKQDVKAA